MSSPQAWVKFESIDKTHGRFIVSPLKRGMGTTIGNSLRRVLLSSLSGCAITAVNIKGVKHEFSTLPNIAEDVLDVIKNLKSIVFISHSEEPKKVTLKYSGKGKITAEDLTCDSEVEIVTKKQYIAEATAKAELEIEVVVENGVGYSASENNRKDDMDVNTIYVDASFSPIRRVNHAVESIRVGKELDYDQLTLDVWTNGGIAPDKAVQEVSEILTAQFELFGRLNQEPVSVSGEETEEGEGDNKDAALDLTIEDLELSARSLNCLKKAGVVTVAELINKDESELIQIKNFGKKSATEINEKLKQYGLCLKQSQFVEA